MDDLLGKLNNHEGKYRLLTWLVTEPSLREPATLEALAAEIDVSSRSLREWKREDTFVKLWRAQAYDTVGSPAETQRVIEAMKAQALDPLSLKQVSAANTFLKAVGAMTPPAETQVKQESVLEDLSLEELEELAVGIFGKRMDQLGINVKDDDVSV